MDIKKKVELVIEQRQAEAMKKDLTKNLKKIARYLGHELTGNTGSEEGISGSFFENTEYYENDNEDELPIFEGSFDKTIGYHIDLLSSGIDLQIMYFIKEDSIRVQYLGNKVYEDSANNLIRYLPDDAWERYIKLLLKKVPEQVKIQEREELAKQSKTSKFQVSKVLEYLSKNWGIG